MKFTLPEIKAPKSKATYNGKLGTLSYKVADLLNWILTGKLIGYVHNRGGEDGCPKIEMRMARNIADNLDIAALGTILIGTDSKQMVLGDAHNRIQGLLLRYSEGKLTSQELNSNVSIRFVDSKDLIDKYIKVNTSLKHTAINRIANPDLAYGHLLMKVCARLTPDSKQKLIQQGKFLTFFCAVANAFRKRGINWNYPTVYLLRCEATGLQNTLAGSVHLASTQIESIAFAVEQYFDFCQDVLALSKKIVNPKRLLHTTGMFGIYIVDRTSSESKLPTNKILAKHLLKKYDQLSKILPVMSQGTSSDIISNYALAMKMLV